MEQQYSTAIEQEDSDHEKVESLSDIRTDQKEAIGLLSIGTFLEYFDLMLYVHMAVLLNELFFPKTDARTAAVVQAFAFCSTYLLRPFGALIFGWIGDNIGRKSTVIITTILMSISCIVMAVVPTYAQMGIAATWIVSICRIIQGMSSLGEIIGAEIYLTELIKPPKQYPAVALIGTASSFGGMAALGIASVVTMSAVFSPSAWRGAFFIGAIIAIVGTLARTALRETPEFVDAKRRLRKTLEETREKLKLNSLSSDSPVVSEKMDKLTALSYFLIQCAWPAVFYFVYVYCGNMLKENFHYSSEEVIRQAFYVSIVQLARMIGVTILSTRIYPIKILNAAIPPFFILVLIIPFVLSNARNGLDIFMLQAALIIFRPSDVPAAPIFYKHFPIFKRFTYSSMLYAFARGIMHFITSFGSVMLINYFGNIGILIILLPATIAYALSVNHFEKLEKASGNYPQKKEAADFQPYLTKSSVQNLNPNPA